MNATETPIIELEDVEASFTSRVSSLFKPNKMHAMHGINLSVLRGQALGLVDESNCGKSAIANVVCGLVAPTAGKVYLSDEEVTKHTMQARRRISHIVFVIFQDPTTTLNPRMTVRDQLANPVRVHKIGTEEKRQKRVMELILVMGLPSSALETLPGQLSGGQRQRVAVARAFSLNLGAIIADEPTSALDVSVQAQVLNLLTDLKREPSLSMVFISHDIQTIRYISDCITVMNKSLTVEEKPAHQLLENPKDPYTHTLLGVAPSPLHPTLEGK